MSIMVGTGRGATAGVLIKNAEALEVLEKVDTVVVDKTGTLTEGKPKLTTVEVVSGASESEVLRLAASLEKASEHPLAAAIVAGAQAKQLQLAKDQAFQSSTGKGIFGIVEGKRVALESAAVTLVKGDLRGIAKACRLSQGTMRNIRQNLFFAFFYNLLGVPIAAGVLYPIFGVLLSPMIASAAMTFSSVSVISNALRLNRLEI